MFTGSDPYWERAEVVRCVERSGVDSLLKVGLRLDNRYAVSTVSRDSLQWLICKIPDKISHSITMSMTVTPTSMTSPSRKVNFDRFMAPLPS